MKFWIWFLFWPVSTLMAQQPEQINMMEDQADTEDVREVEEDIIQLHVFLVKPLNVNRASAEELSVFPFLTSLHIEALMQYRKLTGDLIDVLELQAVPGWSAELVRKMRPYATVKKEVSLRSTLTEDIGRGKTQLLFRSSLSANAGFLMRYQFNAPHIQWGVNTEKDAGEKFLQPGKGLSFISFHGAIKNLGMIRQLVVGDFIVNMGQGLMLWQGRSVRKTAMPIMVKKQSPFLQPYRSNDENRFFRGAAIHLARRKFEAVFFLSSNRLDANLKTDTVSNFNYVSSFLNTGYHRTADELADKNVLGYLAAGGMGSYHNHRLRVSVNFVHHQFSLPVIRANELYNVFAARGRNQTNYGAQYHYTWRNMHVFGELAFDGMGHPAAIQGLMAAVDSKFDLSLVARKIDRAYRSFQANAFTEASEPNNEEGVYLGASYRLKPNLSLDLYSDFYRFPWLRYRIDAPGWGQDQLIQISYKPDKKTLIYFRHRIEVKSGAGVSQQVKARADYKKLMSRLHLEFRPSLEWEWRFRIEFNALTKGDPETENGFLAFSDLFWSPLDRPYGLNARLMLFDTKSYDTRIYSFENDVMFYSLVPPFYGHGARIYLNMKYKMGERWQQFLKISRSFNGVPGKWNFRFQILFQM